MGQTKIANIKNVLQKTIQYCFCYFEKKGLWIIMDKQKINCTVGSCKFNDYNNQECILKQITVTPKQNCNTKKPEESMCSSYEC